MNARDRTRPETDALACRGAGRGPTSGGDVIMAGFDGHADLLARIGKHRTGKSCLYVKRLANLDLDALGSLIGASVDRMRRRLGAGG